MAQKYYNSAETAKLLGKSVDEIKQMLERRELHGYRDGADWKFKVEDIDRLAKDQPKPAGDVGDVLLSEVELGQSDPGLSGTVIGFSEPGRPVSGSDIRLAESDIQLGESKTPIPIKKKDDSKTALSELDLTLEEDLTIQDSKFALDSSTAKPAKSGDSSVVDMGSSSLEDDELVLGGSSSKGSDVTLGGDSGISLIDPSDSGLSLETPLNLGAAAEESLELGEDDMLATSETADQGSSGKIKADSDFLLTPLEESTADESESGSQVIALDTEAEAEEDAGMVGAAAGGVSMATMLDEDLSDQPSLEMGMAAPLAGTPGLSAQPGALAEGASLMQTAVSSLEPPYTPLQLVGLGFCLFLMLLCGIVVYDLMQTLWSEQAVSSGSPSSWLMDTVLGWIEGR
ncbi:MAG: helix-turn-helix domain-containing protein [Thermoguttaceae bacterium]